MERANQKDSSVQGRGPLQRNIRAYKREDSHMTHASEIQSSESESDQCGNRSVLSGMVACWRLASQQLVGSVARTPKLE